MNATGPPWRWINISHWNSHVGSLIIPILGFCVLKNNHRFESLPMCPEVAAKTTFSRTKTYDRNSRIVLYIIQLMRSRHCVNNGLPLKRTQTFTSTNDRPNIHPITLPKQKLVGCIANQLLHIIYLCMPCPTSYTWIDKSLGRFPPYYVCQISYVWLN